MGTHTNSEQDRFRLLSSFSRFPLPKDHQLSAIKFAEAGFERQAFCSSDEVYCCMCGLKYGGWSGKKPLVVHRTLRPNCPFLNTPPSTPTTKKNLPAAVASRKELFSNIFQSVNDTKDGNMMDNNNNSLFGLHTQSFPSYDYDILASNLLKYKNTGTLHEIQHPFVPKCGDFYKYFESMRLLSFEFPCSIQASDYANAGFFYDRTLSCAVCFFCDFETPYIPQQKRMLEFCHEEKSPKCPFVRGIDVGNISRSEENLIKEEKRKSFLNSYINDIEEGSISYTIKYPEYKDSLSRSGTFKSWPALQSSEFPIDTMVKCGFYYTNFMDSVRCFSCGITLSNWSKGVDPFAEHAKASPQCWHILQTKGEEFIRVAQQLQLEVIVDNQENAHDSNKLADSQSKSSTSSSPQTSLSSSPCSSLATSPSRMKVGSPILDLDAIAAATACQYSIEQITDAVIKFFILSSGSYPNPYILIGTLRAADANHKALCEQQEEIIKKTDELYETKSQLKAKDSLIEARDRELARQQFIQSQQNVELRTTFEQFVKQNNEVIYRNQEMLQRKDGIIQQNREIIHQKDEMLHQKEEMLEQKDEMLQTKDIELELKNREVEDLRRQMESMRAALEMKDKQCCKVNEAVCESPRETTTATSTSTSHQDEFPVANCKVCLTNKSSIVFFPCKHLCCCDSCGARLVGKSCPICREPNLTMEKVYVI